jgi:glucose-6-phosphate 1-dehydrogenase
VGWCPVHTEGRERFVLALRVGLKALLIRHIALNEQKTEVRIQFKDVTSGIFKDIPRNEMVIRVQPNESVYIKMNSKLPGLSMQTVVTELDLTYRRRFSDLKIPEAYESLILDALKGDRSNFVRDDELDASWRIFTPLLHYLDDNKEIMPMSYPYGKWSCGIATARHNLSDDI